MSRQASVIDISSPFYPSPDERIPCPDCCLRLEELHDTAHDHASACCIVCTGLLLFIGIAWLIGYGYTMIDQRKDFNTTGAMMLIGVVLELIIIVVAISITLCILATRRSTV